MAVMPLALPSPLADAAQRWAAVSAVQKGISFSDLYAEFCLFLVRCLLLPWIAQNICGEMQGSVWCTSAFALCAKRALGVHGYPGWEEGCPHGWHIREHVRTAAYHSSQVTDSSWALIQVLLCLSAWCREVCCIFLFFTPLGIKEMTLSVMFCEVLSGSGSIGMSCTFSSHWWLNPREAEAWTVSFHRVTTGEQPMWITFLFSLKLKLVSLRYWVKT